MIPAAGGPPMVPTPSRVARFRWHYPGAGALVVILSIVASQGAGCASSPPSVNDGVFAAYGGDDGTPNGGPVTSPSLDGGATSFSAIRPTFGPTVVAGVSPPPISGGTLLVTADGARAVIADPDRDVIYGVGLGTSSLAYTVALQKGDEPGRL